MNDQRKIPRHYVENALNYATSIKGELEKGLEGYTCAHFYLREKLNALTFEIERIEAGGAMEVESE
jgi:hypothetical protein